jgi:ELWxxDGT repeat protein
MIVGRNSFLIKFPGIISVLLLGLLPKHAHARQPNPTLIADINQTPTSGFPSNLTPFGQKPFMSAYSSAYSSADGDEPWVFNAETGQSTLLADVEPGPFGSSPVFTVANNLVFFTVAGRWPLVD